MVSQSNGVKLFLFPEYFFGMIDKYCQKGATLVMHIIKRIESSLYNPVVLVLLTPLSYLLIGTIYAMQYTDLNVGKFIVFYLLLFINYCIEHFLGKHLSLKKEVFKKTFIVLEIANLLFIAYISVYSHYSVGLLIILYSLAIHSKQALKENQFPIVAILIIGLFKGGILTYLSFFSQAQFLPLMLILWSTPLIFLHLFVEFGSYLLERTSSNVAKGQSYLLLFSMVLIYFLTLIFLFSSFKIWLLLFILTFPIAFRLAKLFYTHTWKMSKSMTLKTIRIYQLSYIITFTLAEAVYFLSL